MIEPIWVPVEAVHIIHDRQIARHGSASGLRDEELLQNALQRPVNNWQHEDADTFDARQHARLVLQKHTRSSMETNGLH